MGKNPPVNNIMSEGQQLNWSDFPLPNGKKDPDYQEWVSHLVSTNKDKWFNLKHPTGARLKITALDNTIYKDDDDVVNGWGKFYLQDPVNMQVFGVVEGVPCPCDQLVLMTCEDKKVYAYDEEGLHLVASSLKQLCDEGLQYPTNKTYYKGDAFKHMTAADWARVRQGPVGKRLDEEHRQRVQKEKPRFLKNIRRMRGITDGQLLWRKKSESEKINNVV